MVIFGTGKIAQVAHACLSDEHDVVGFTVDRAYLDPSPPTPLPVVAFDDVVERFPPAEVRMFVAMGYHDLNAVRAARLAQAAALGYGFVSWVSPRASIGKGVEIGANCLVMPQASVQPFARLEDGVFVWDNAVIGHHAHIGAHCWITAGAVVASSVGLGAECFLGANAVIVNEVTVGRRCLIGAGALVSAAAADNGVYVAPGTERLRLDSDRFLKISKMR
ncbi:DapH/DapD/GlmU-related protein [Paramagnetospirillum marisnigri]|uniref:DapH/DapD/GlmU-related protein n=1 Tax=Paramagnetospirillum marisnigri TaxID=1285242 RepID=UPI001FE00A5C|nr:DapH/DapD/GlmU-related protein [Paramagnetospirillum marisnigri]